MYTFNVIPEYLIFTLKYNVFDKGVPSKVNELFELGTIGRNI